MNRPPLAHGAATLGITLLLLFIVMLVAGFANRNLIFEQRTSANQWRSTQAFEAAEAGLEWAQAMLASDATIGADCKPDATAGNTAFRERLLAWDADARSFTPRTWTDNGQPVVLQAACVLGAEGWACSCPADGAPALDAPPAAGAHPSFAIRFAAADRAGQVQLLATGCDRFAADCVAAAGESSAKGSTAHAQVTLALLPALAGVPAAALTARAAIDASGALTLANTDPQGSGLTAHAGGTIALTNATLQTLPDANVESSLAASDPALAALAADRVASRFFGVDAARWQRLPGVRHIECEGDCSAALHAELAAGHRRIRVAGDVQIAAASTYGTPERPVLLVVDGPLQLGAGVRIHGAVVHLAALCDTSGTHGARIDGALICGGSVIGDGTPAIVYDRAALAQLNGEAGVFVRVAGSWRDF